MDENTPFNRKEIYMIKKLLIFILLVALTSCGIEVKYENTSVSNPSITTWDNVEIKNW